MKKILFLVGSLRQDSLNKRVSTIAASLLSEGYEALHFDIGTLPFYSSDLDGETVPEVVKNFRQAMTDADGVFFTSPEYNYSLPGVVKNAIDWASRPMLPRHPMVGKPMNVVVATLSPTNGIRSLTDIKHCWRLVGGYPVGPIDLVLQSAWSIFEEVEGKDTLNAASLTAVQDQIKYLVTAIESAAGTAQQKNWDAFAASKG